MNTDSADNVVVFEVLLSDRLEQLLGEGPTRATDGIRRVWDHLADAYGLRSVDVWWVYSQWEPTPEERAFFAAEFPPTVEVSFSFRRPPARRDWGNGTLEFTRAVDEFEQAYYATRNTEAGAGLRPWWQYWEWPGEGKNPFTDAPVG